MRKYLRDRIENGTIRVEGEGDERDRRSDGEEHEDEYDESEMDALINEFDYMKRSDPEEWDVETVLSTRSNLDNRPRTISIPGRVRPQPDSKVQLSRKTGIPLDTIPGKSKSVHECVILWETIFQLTSVSRSSENKGVARRRNESSEERRARKLKLKADKQVRLSLRPSPRASLPSPSLV